ncbi:hypothetical protein ACLBVR_37115, partial [Pseudomonas aeruginosa]|uniref:hypothetical protein n=1 Tax=Pseudomonas aeruginosa TaxID=287 RepID=UPI003967EC45
MKLTLTPPLTPSHWMRSTDLADAACAPLVGTHSADVAIVGGRRANDTEYGLAAGVVTQD